MRTQTQTRAALSAFAELLTPFAPSVAAEPELARFPPLSFEQIVGIIRRAEPKWSVSVESNVSNYTGELTSWTAYVHRPPNYDLPNEPRMSHAEGATAAEALLNAFAASQTYVRAVA